jgi:hypothetical protein
MDPAYSLSIIFLTFVLMGYLELETASPDKSQEFDLELTSAEQPRS